MTPEQHKQVEAALGDKVICERCGATLETYADVCAAELDERCEGFEAIEAAAKAKPKIVVLLGSSRFVDVMAVCAWLLERDEGRIALGLHLLPRWYSFPMIADHIAEHEGVAEHMDTLHLAKLELADEAFVVNRDDYVGESTGREIARARELGVPLRWYTHDPIGTEVERRIAEHIRLTTPIDPGERDQDGARGRLGQEDENDEIDDDEAMPS